MTERENKIKNGLMAVFILLMLIVVIFILKGYLADNFRDAESLRKYIIGYGIFGPFILIAIQALQVILPVLPGFLGCIVGAGMYGVWGGFWCNYIGISAGSIIAFWLAKKYGSALVNKMVPVEKYATFIEWINQQKSYTVALFLAILLPLAPDDFLCYFSGLGKMPSKKFVWIIIAAKPWCILFYSYLFGKVV